MEREDSVELTPRETRKAAHVASRFDLLKLERMMRRTEERIDRIDPAAKAVFVAMAYLCAGAFAAVPAAIVFATLRPAGVICCVFGILTLFFLRTARNNMKENYSKHSSWRILNRAVRTAQKLSS